MRGGFTLTEIIMGVMVFSILLAVVTGLQTGGAKAVTKISWHGGVNQQGHFLEKFIPRAIERASVPSLINTDQTQYSTSTNHSIRAFGTSIVPTGTNEQLILQIPQAMALIPPATVASITWTELVMKRWDSGWNKDLGQLFYRERTATYNSASYVNVAKPTTGGTLELLLDDVSRIDISKPNTNTITLEITCSYPRDRKHTQKFRISGVAENRTSIILP